MGDSGQEEVYMDKELVDAIRRGDLSFLEKAVKREEESGDGNFHYFLRQTEFWRRNILHLGIFCKNYKWVEEALKLLPTHVIQQLLLQRDSSGGAPIHFATFSKNIEILKVLDEYFFRNQDGDEDEILKICGIKNNNEDGYTLLHYATYVDNVDIVKYLVEKHPGLAPILNNSDQTFLHLAVVENTSMSFVRAFDDAIGDQDYKMKLWSMRNAKGNTPLHCAAILGKPKIVEFLMERHPQLFSLANKEQETPLQYKITDYPDRTCKIDNNNSTYIHLAAALNKVRFLRAIDDEFTDDDYKIKLWSTTNKDGNTPLHSAAIKGATEVVEFFLERHPQLASVVNNNKETPLHLVITHYETFDDNVKVTAGEISSIIKILVERNSDVTLWKDANGYTPLHRAAYLCTTYNVEVVKFIIQHSSQSSQVRDNFGNTILHLMVNRITNNQQGKYLLSVPELIDLRDTINNEGERPLDCALKTNIIMVRVLVDAATKQSPIISQDISATTLIQQQTLLKMMGKQSTKMEEYGIVDDVMLIRKLVYDFGVNFLLFRDSNKRNVLHKLLHIDKVISISIDAYVQSVHEILVNYPILVCERDVNGDTPIHILARNPQKVQLYVGTNNNSFELSSLDYSNLSSKLLELCRVYYYKAKASQEGSHYPPPWLVQNIVGNTPLHDSLIVNCHKILERDLYKLDINIVGGLTNKNKETPLHLLAGQSSSKSLLSLYGFYIAFLWPISVKHII